MSRFQLEDYEPVEDRLARFWADHPGGRVKTDLISHGDGGFIIRAEIWREAGDPDPWATGWAEERVTDRGVNATSALENCETSAIGRALANAGYAPKGKRPSREEMAKAQRQAEEKPKSFVPVRLFEELLFELANAVTSEQLEKAKLRVRDVLSSHVMHPEDLKRLEDARDASAHLIEEGQK